MHASCLLSAHELDTSVPGREQTLYNRVRFQGCLNHCLVPARLLLSIGVVHRHANVRRAGLDSSAKPSYERIRSQEP